MKYVDILHIRLSKLSLACLTVLGFASSCFAQLKCSEILINQPVSQNEMTRPALQIQSLDLDDTKVERAFENIMLQIKNPEATIYATPDGKPKKVKMQLSAETLQKSMDHFSRSLLRPLGVIFNFEGSEGKNRTVISRNEPLFSKNKLLALQAMEKTEPVRPEFREIINKYLGTISTDKSVSITVNKFEVRDWTLTESQKSFFHKVQSYFVTKNAALVDWVYKKEESKFRNPMESARLLDDFTHYAKHGKYFKFHMAYRDSVWEAQLRLLQYWYDHPDPVEGDFGYFSQDVPLLPFAGVITAESTDFTSVIPVEIKRYFKNEYEDPFELTEKEDINYFVYRYKMISQAIEDLAPQTIVELHAPTRVHVMAYKKMGFQVVGEYFDTKLSETQVVMRATREHVIETIQFIINNYQSSSANP